MKVFKHKGQSYFPQEQKLLKMLKDGDQFKTKIGTSIYTIEGHRVFDENKKEAFFTPFTPVVPLKIY